MILYTLPEEVLNTENLFSKVTGLDIFKYYISNFPGVDRKFYSELRKDSNPSCVVGLFNDRYIYSDFGDRTGIGPIEYVMIKHNLDFYSALEKINEDFDLKLKGFRVGKGGTYSQRPKLKYTNSGRRTFSSDTKIQIKRTPFSKADKEYWMQYGITKEILKLYRVSSISHYWITKDGDTNRYNVNKQLAYAYRFKKYKYKIYVPKGDKYSKWRCNVGRDVLQGWDQLPEDGPVLVITKSMKDVMCFYAMGIAAIAPQAESNYIDEEKIEELKGRFKIIFSNYDFDMAGIVGANSLKRKYDIHPLFLTNGRFNSINYMSKDFSDYIKQNGVEAANILINATIENLKPIYHK